MSSRFSADLPLALYSVWYLLLLFAGRYFLSGHRLAALSGVVTNIIKVIAGRGRPKPLDQHGVVGFDPFTLDARFHSFPSGHTNTFFAVALAISLLIPQWRSGLLAVASVLGFSRVAVNAHFLTDVIAGAALAWPTTRWLRQRLTAYGLFFTKGGAGEYTPRWPGLLIPVAAYPHIRRILSPDEPTPVGWAGMRLTKKRLRGPMPDGAAELLYMEEPHHRCDTLVIGRSG